MSRPVRKPFADQARLAIEEIERIRQQLAIHEKRAQYRRDPAHANAPQRYWNAEAAERIRRSLDACRQALDRGDASQTFWTLREALYLYHFLVSQTEHLEAQRQWRRMATLDRSKGAETVNARKRGQQRSVRRAARRQLRKTPGAKKSAVLDSLENEFSLSRDRLDKILRPWKDIEEAAGRSSADSG